MEITLPQLLVLIAYFLSVYLYKMILDRSDVSQNTYFTLKALIPAVNLIAGLLLGYFGVASFDITMSVLGTLATGGTADLLKMPSKINNL